MKKLFLAIAAIALMVSCSGNKFVVKGTIDPEMADGGDIIVMSDNFSAERDTAQIVDGKFTFTGPASTQTVKQLVLVSDGRPITAYACIFIPEAGTIEINLDEATVKGGTVNDALNKYNYSVNNIMNEYSSKAQQLSQTLTEPELSAELEKAADAAQASLDNVNLETLNANKDNALGFIALSDMIYYFESLAEYEEAMDGAADFIKNYEPFNEIRTSLISLNETSEGSKFVDFKGENAKGQPISLSDYVGKGKWVLVDFWASWCGPCKQESPNIISVYNKYNGKDFTVIGVPVWDERADTDVALKELGIKYDQIFVGDDRTSTEVYGINGIPHLILFAPDGTIAKRNLRGSAIEEAVKEALQK